MNIPIALAHRIIAQLLNLRVLNSNRIRSIGRMFDWLDGREIRFVQKQVALTKSPEFRTFALVINYLSNGLIYILVGVLLLVALGWPALPIVFAALLSVGGAHLIYPLIKSFLKRPRPMDRDQALEALAPPLDLYSCPSGHCMTTVATAIPIAFVLPKLSLIFIFMLILIAWGRLATAHHYPSDLVLGGLLGGAVAWPVTHLVLA